ncbi:hypothetical protein F4815DRAFT_449258 [Daldinia loculata]|nr:hypothetical protein F4815DRAFT_449258 [Daldinia loculata]
MKSFHSLYLIISISIYIVATFANRLGGVNRFGSGSASNHHLEVSDRNRNGLVGAHDNAAQENKKSNHGSSNNNHGSGNNNHGSGNNNHGDGSVASHNEGQNNGHGSHGVNSIVNAIHSANQQIHTVNRAIRSVRNGGTIEHLDLAFQSLSSTIKTTSAAITSAKSLGDGDFQSIQSAIKPFHQSIGSLITQLVARRDTIAQLCGCRPIQGAVNHIRISTRDMFDGIKNHLNHGGPLHGRPGFGGFHSLDSGIQSFLNHGYNAFGFGNCIDVASSEFSTYYTTQTSTWAPSTITDYTTVVDTLRVDFTYSPSYTTGGGYEATDVPLDYDGDIGSSNTYGQHGDIYVCKDKNKYNSNFTNDLHNNTHEYVYELRQRGHLNLYKDEDEHRRNFRNFGAFSNENLYDDCHKTSTVDSLSTETSTNPSNTRANTETASTTITYTSTITSTSTITDTITSSVSTFISALTTTGVDPSTITNTITSSGSTFTSVLTTTSVDTSILISVSISGASTSSNGDLPGTTFTSTITSLRTSTLSGSGSGTRTLTSIITRTRSGSVSTAAVNSTSRRRTTSSTASTKSGPVTATVTVSAGNPVSHFPHLIVTFSTTYLIRIAESDKFNFSDNYYQYNYFLQIFRSR